MATRSRDSPQRPSPRSIVEEARTKPAPVYVFFGEAFQTEALARRLTQVLVPQERRATNLEVYDGASVGLDVVLDSCRTLGLFGGGKVIWMREPKFLAAGEKRSDISAAMFAAWSAERRKPAGEKLVALAAQAGWTQADFESRDFAALNKTKAKTLLGRDLAAGEGQILASIRAHAVERGMRLSSQRDEGGLLEEFLASDAAGDSILIFTASNVDKRRKIFKQVQKIGVVAELSLERERSGALSEAAVNHLVNDTLADAGKRASPRARAAIARRAGGDPGLLHSELEKICLYAGDAETIEEEHVAAAMRDLGESWIFDFTRALSQRRSAEAVALLRGLFAQGEPPLRLLAMIAREVRILLAAREILSTTLARSWSDRTHFNAFRDQMLPAIPDEQKQAIGGAHPYVLYLALQNASRTTSARLERALIDLHELDIALKSSNTDPRVRLEAFVLAM